MEELGGGEAVTGASIGVVTGLTNCPSSQSQTACQTERFTWETWRQIENDKRFTGHE